MTLRQMDAIKTALDNALKTGVLCEAQFKAVQTALGHNSSISSSSESKRARVAPPSPDNSLVSLPPSFRVATGTVLTRAVNFRDTVQRNCISVQKLASCGLSVTEFYNLNFTLKDLLPLTVEFLTAPAIRLGELWEFYGIDCNHTAVKGQNLCAEELAKSENTAKDYCDFGYRASDLLRTRTESPTSADILSSFPFGVDDWVQTLGLTTRDLLLCGFGRNNLTHSGWSYAAVKRCLNLSEEEGRRLGLELKLS